MDDSAEDIIAWLVISLVVSAVIMLVVFWPGSARADLLPEMSSDVTLGWKEVYCVQGESENQGARGMLAVACAMRARGTTKGVYGCGRQVKHRARTFVQAVKAWEESREPKNCKFIGKANAWRSWRDVWRDPMVLFRYRLTAIVRGHLFFIEK